MIKESKMVLAELIWLVLAVVGAAYGGGLPFLLFAVNIGVLLLFGCDKRAAVKRLPRIPERELLFWTALGGSAGAMVAILLFKHKSAKWSLTGWVVILFALHCALLAYLV